MIILGIDPGSCITGYGIIETHASRYKYVASGCIRTKGEEVCDKLYQIYEKLSTIIGQYRPDQAAIEKIFFKNNVDSAFKLGQARGAAFVAVATYRIPLSEYTPRAVKKSVVGYGAADKQQVQRMMKTLLCLSALPQVDAADALAIALCHASYARQGELK